MKAILANPSAKLEDVNVEFLQEGCAQYQQQAHLTVTDWNCLHDTFGSYADEHSML